MARKRQKPEGDRPRRRSRPSPPGDLPDRRAMEGVMRELVRSMQGNDEDTPLSRAQALMYRAFEEDDAQQRIQLAHDALVICPDCADAFVLLAEQSSRRKESLELYQKGVEAGERALGPEVFHQERGRFWGILKTRPYMRARLGLAHALWTVARRDEAVQHLQDMLRLNPGDNQGVRYTLAGFLLFLDRDDDLADLFRQYPDEASAAWAYTKALLTFRQHGDTPEARTPLQIALKMNQHVPAYLLGHKFPTSERPEYYSPGDENEALEYLGSFLVGWKDTPGAIAWLRGAVKDNHKKDGPQPKGPLGFIKKWLKGRLKQVFDVWQADFRQTPNKLKIGGEVVRPWFLLVTSRLNDLVLAHQLVYERPSSAFVWDTLVQAMQNPVTGEPHRPSELQVRPDPCWESLQPHIDEIGIELTVKEDLDQVDTVFGGLSEHLGEQPETGLLDVPGMNPKRVGSFFEAAALFFRQSPWKAVGYEAAIKVECSKFQSGPWYAVLMGQSGLTTGLALYEDLKILRRAWERPTRPEGNARRSVATTVIFGDEIDMALADVEAARRYGWELARPDAWPSVFHKERGLSHRPPLVWELELMEGCLRAIPEFLKRRKQDDFCGEEFTFPVETGALTLVLSWVSESGE